MSQSYTSSHSRDFHRRVHLVMQEDPKYVIDLTTLAFRIPSDLNHVVERLGADIAAHAITLPPATYRLLTERPDLVADLAHHNHLDMVDENLMRHALESKAFFTDRDEIFDAQCVFIDHMITSAAIEKYDLAVQDLMKQDQEDADCSLMAMITGVLNTI